MPEWYGIVDGMNPYELPAQVPEEHLADWFKHPVRFLGNDGGIKSGIIVAVLPSARLGIARLRILDTRRNQFYSMYEDEFQVMKPRKD